MPDKRFHAYFSGRVQGVGFRFTAQSIANDLKISGWVRNTDDGRVEVAAQGPEKRLNDFLSKLKGYFCRYITDVDIDWQQALDDENDFQIKF